LRCSFSEHRLGSLDAFPGKSVLLACLVGTALLSNLACFDGGPCGKFREVSRNVARRKAEILEIRINALAVEFLGALDDLDPVSGDERAVRPCLGVCSVK